MHLRHPRVEPSLTIAMAPFTTAVRLFAPGPLKQRRQVVVPRLVQSFADEVVDAPFRGQRESIDDASDSPINGSSA